MLGLRRDWSRAVAGSVLLHLGLALALLAGASLGAARPVITPIRVTLIAALVESPPALAASTATPTPAPARRQPKPRPAPAARAESASPAAAVVPPAPVGPAAATPEAEPPSRRAPGTLARPAYARNPAPEYPAVARRRRQEGLVLLGVTVTPAGRAARVALVRSSGVAALDEAALAAVRGWEFEPARADGVAVACEIEVPVRFQLAN